MLWWGRFGPEYSRNRILRKLLQDMDWVVSDFHPTVSPLGDLQALWKRIRKPDLIWVPCFRQRDVSAARRYSQRFHIPLLFDPLISAYDKQVFEKKKFDPDGGRATRLLRWERRRFQSADLLLADTSGHALFFTEVLGVPSEKIFVVPVGAEESVFIPQPPPPSRSRLQILFFGSFIPLQGVHVIVQAARRVPEVDWVLLGQGPLRTSCEAAAAGLPQVRFEDWMAYEQLPTRIGQADILLGIFGNTPKALRVIPNKFYQAIACARPIITLDSPAYTHEVHLANSGGVQWIPASNALALAEAVRMWAKCPEQLAARGRDVRNLYERFYSLDRVRQALDTALSRIV